MSSLKARLLVVLTILVMLAAVSTAPALANHDGDDDCRWLPGAGWVDENGDRCDDDEGDNPLLSGSEGSNEFLEECWDLWEYLLELRLDPFVIEAILDEVDCI